MTGVLAGKCALHQTMADVLARLGTERAVVVHGTDGLGEVSLSAPTEVIEVTAGGQRAFTWEPGDFGLSRAGQQSLAISSPAESAEVIRRVLAGESGPPREVVVLNAAAALWTAGVSDSPRECAERAAEAIDRGGAQQLLKSWGELSHHQP